MILGNIIGMLEALAPPSFQEQYDNSGLLTGNSEMQITGALISIDCTEAVIGEAIRKKCNLVISHHPLVFGGVKRLTGNDYVQRTIIKAIKNDIAVYALHTNLDNVYNGVNAGICGKLGLKNCRILAPKKGMLRKLYTFCPENKADEVRLALFNAGCGHIGNYDQCSFNTAGFGTFRALEGSDPYVGKKGKQHREKETRIETIFPAHLEKKVIGALLSSHPYEEVAYDIVPLENEHNRIGSGMIGELEKPAGEMAFLGKVKKTLKAGCVKYTPLLGRKIRKVAVCGGSGSFLLQNAIASGADIFISSDFKYHQFFDADGQIIIADIGHYESEQFTKELVADFINQKFSTFAPPKDWGLPVRLKIQISEINTNPVLYL